MKHTTLPPVVTIDGGAGTGKGAERLFLTRLTGYHGLDSGVLYRVLGYLVYKYKIPLENTDAICAIAKNLPFTLQKETIFVEGVDCTKEVRSETIGGAYASKVAQIPAVRFTLREYQLSMRKFPGLIAEGRDQGFIFDTPYRFFLKTSAEERARRRVLQFQSLGLPADYNSILKAILERDESDRYNPAHPLVPHEEAMVIHTDRLTIKQVARIIVAACTDVKFLKRNKNPFI